eukprot:12933322-Alexandrium_andersonii.AAC.1
MHDSRHPQPFASQIRGKGGSQHPGRHGGCRCHYRGCSAGDILVGRLADAEMLPEELGAGGVLGQALRRNNKGSKAR